MSSPILDVADWSMKDFAAVIKKLGGPEVAQRLKGCREVKCTFEDDAVAVVTGIVPVNVSGLTLTYLGVIELPALDVTIEQRVTACECTLTDDARRYITSQHFKVTVTGSRHLYLAHFGKDMSNEALDQAFATLTGKQEALIEDILAVGAHPRHRELQRQFPITTRRPSVMVEQRVRVPCLDGWGGGRGLGLGCRGNGWSGRWRFLLVSNKPLAA